MQKKIAGVYTLTLKRYYTDIYGYIYIRQTHLIHF